MTTPTIQSMHKTMTGLLQGNQHAVTAKDVLRAYDVLDAMVKNPSARAALRMDTAKKNASALHHKAREQR